MRSDKGGLPISNQSGVPQRVALKCGAAPSVTRGGRRRIAFFALHESVPGESRRVRRCLFFAVRESLVWGLSRSFGKATHVFVSSSVSLFDLKPVSSSRPALR